MALGDRAIAWLRTPIATLIVLLAALLAQLPHAADVFRLVVHGAGIWQVLHSYSYAVALELAVLLFVVQRRNAESYIFAVVSVCVNLAYYALHGVDLFSVASLPAWLISLALPAAIARYSHLIVDATHAGDDAVPSPLQHAATPATHAATVDALPIADMRTQALQMASEGMSAVQIARALGANSSTVRSWLKRAQR